MAQFLKQGRVRRFKYKLKSGSDWTLLVHEWPIIEVQMMQFSILLLNFQCDNYVDSGILAGCLIRCALFMGKRMLSYYTAKFSVEVYGY